LVKNLNAADYLILIVLGLSTLTSMMRGFVSEVMSLVVWALALYASSTLSGVFAETFLAGVEQQSVRIGGAYLIVFLLVLISGGLVNWMIRRIMSKTGLSGTDRLLGAAFGFSRGLLIVFSAVLFAGFTSIPKQPVWQESALLPAIGHMAQSLSTYLPPSVRTFLNFTVPSLPAAQPATEQEPSSR
jgi:membrane protein required for colicin V production